MSEADDNRGVDKVVHGLRNHLTIILGFSELLLERTPADDPCRADISQINEAAVAALERLAELTRSLP